MHALTRRSFARTSLLSLGALTAATACSSADGSDPSAASDGGDGSAGSWPRTVTLGNSEITLDAAPQRIVAVSTETGDLALELVGPERMAGLVEGAQDPSSANQSEARAAGRGHRRRRSLPGSRADPLPRTGPRAAH